MPHPANLDIFTKPYAALELKPLIDMTMSPSRNEKVNIALESYLKNMALSKKAIYGGVDSYNREKFEKEYGLKWQITL